MPQLSNRIKTTLCKTTVAAGSSDITDALAVDMQDYEGVRFIFSFGVITSGAVTSVGAASKVSSSPTPGTDDLVGSKQDVADTDDDSVFVIDIYKPRLRYVRPFVKRATQNAVLNSIIAEQYGPKKAPVTNHTSVHGQELWVSPDVGTA